MLFGVKFATKFLASAISLLPGILKCLDVTSELLKSVGPNKPSAGLRRLRGRLILCISQAKVAERVLLSKCEERGSVAACSPARGMPPPGPAHVELAFHLLISTAAAASAEVNSSPEISLRSKTCKEEAYGGAMVVLPAFLPRLHRQRSPRLQFCQSVLPIFKSSLVD